LAAVVNSSVCDLLKLNDFHCVKLMLIASISNSKFKIRLKIPPRSTCAGGGENLIAIKTDDRFLDG